MLRHMLLFAAAAWKTQQRTDNTHAHTNTWGKSMYFHLKYASVVVAFNWLSCHCCVLLAALQPVRTYTPCICVCVFLRDQYNRLKYTAVPTLPLMCLRTVLQQEHVFKYIYAQQHV